jgi:hypothetical protein
MHCTIPCLDRLRDPRNFLSNGIRAVSEGQSRGPKQRDNANNHSYPAQHQTFIKGRSNGFLILRPSFLLPPPHSECTKYLCMCLCVIFLSWRCTNSAKSILTFSSTSIFRYEATQNPMNKIKQLYKLMWQVFWSWFYLTTFYRRPIKLNSRSTKTRRCS